MQRLLFMTFLILLVSSILVGCTVREELQYRVELRDRNLGFTVENFTVACIITHPELVDTLNVTLTDQNDQSISIQTTSVSTITEVAFTEVPAGTYQSTCTVCSGDDCRSDTSGSVLVSLEDTPYENYEFDLPPTFILGTPIDGTYFLSERPLLVSFTCLANDDVGLTAVSLVSNVSGLFGETFIQNPSRSSHLLTKDLVLQPGKYLWTCRATDTRAQTVVAPVRSFIIGPATPEVLPNTQGFDGDTTDFSKLDRLTDVPDVVIEDTDFGKITFVDNISTLVGVDFSKGIIITQDSITVNSSLYPQLNVPARLSFYNIQFDEQAEEANIEKDGGTYSVQDLTYEDGTLTFTVGNFSTYTVVITPQGGYNLEENQEEEEEEPEPIEVVPDEPDPIIEEPVIEEEIVDTTPDNTPDELAAQENTQETSPQQNTTIPQEQEKNTEPEPIPLEEEDVSTNYFNPLVIVALIVGFVGIIILVIWLIRRNSGGTILRKY